MAFFAACVTLRVKKKATAPGIESPVLLAEREVMHDLLHILALRLQYVIPKRSTPDADRTCAISNHLVYFIQIL